MENTAEYALLVGDVQKFDALEAALKTQFALPDRQALHAYFLALRAYVSGDLKAFANAAENLQTLLLVPGVNRLRNWGFNELLAYGDQQEQSPAKNVLLAIPQAANINAAPNPQSTIAPLSTAIHALRESLK